MFIRPVLDYDNIIYDQTCNVSFHQELELKCNACLAITRAIKATSMEKLYALKWEDQHLQPQ